MAQGQKRRHPVPLQTSSNFLKLDIKHGQSFPFGPLLFRHGPVELMIDPNHLENLEPDLLKTLLEPLFEDFHHWLGRTKTKLEARRLSFLTPEEQQDLLQKVTNAIAEVTAAQALFAATDGRAGVDVKVVMAWHMLVTHCWKVIIQDGKSET